MARGRELLNSPNNPCLPTAFGKQYFIKRVICQQPARIAQEIRPIFNEALDASQYIKAISSGVLNIIRVDCSVPFCIYRLDAAINFIRMISTDV
jgi:hypothetical protein